MRVGVLGPLEVHRGNADVRLSRAQERRLLAALVVGGGRSVSTNMLIEALWPGDEQPAHPARALRTIVSRLRSVIGEGALAVAPGGYRLAVPADDVDATRFEHLVADGLATLQRDDPASALATLDEALSLWRGDAYEEFAAEPFASAEAVRLDELRGSALEARVDSRLALGQHEEVIGELHALVAGHSFSERLRSQLAVALYRCGRQAEALATLRDYRRMLAEELGLEPSPAVQDLEWQILAHRVPGPIATELPGPASRPLPQQRVEDELGVPATRLIGREEAIMRVLEALGAARVVTLVGPGGVGKTRLAARAAGEARSRFPDGLAACPLAPVRDPAAVPAALATALQVRQRGHRSLEDSVVEALGARQVLLVLDNCEHVIDVASHLVARLLRSCPHLTVLATSRARLGLTGERLVDVVPLATPDAVELFRERARAAGVELGDEDGSGGAVREICRRLDGLPLAVELAAAQVRALRPGDIAERLQKSSAPLRAPCRDVADRHRSLQAVTAWSYDLLAEPERALFDGLSVFAGSFEWRAVEEVAVPAGTAAADVPDLLAALVDTSMVAVRPGTGPTRYALLETLRVYGREQLTRRGGEHRWREAHARHYVAVAEQADRGLRGPDEASWMERLAQDMDNLREARRWSLEHDPAVAVRLVAALCWYRYRTVQTELELWAEETADVDPGHPLAPRLLGSAALGAWLRGELVHGARLANRAVAGTSGPEQRLGRDALGAISLVQGNLLDAIHHFEHAAALARQADDAYHEGWCVAGQALLLGYLHRTVESEQRLAQAEAIARELGCPSLSAWVLYTQGERLVEREPDRALELLDRGETLARQVGHQFVRTVAGISAVTVRARRGTLAAALPRFRELLEHLERMGNRTQLWMMLRSLIHVLAKEGHAEPAAVLLAALEASATAVGAFGPDLERLSEAARLIAAGADAAQVAAWRERGRVMQDQQAIAYALASIDSLAGEG